MDRNVAAAPSRGPVVTGGMRRALVLALCVAVTAAALAAPVTATDRDRERTQAEVEFAAQVNAVREDAGVESLVWDDRIAMGARRHVQLVAERGESFSAESLDLELASNVTDWTTGAEVVGDGTSPAEVLTSLLADEARRTTLLGRFNRVGVGLATVDGRTFVVVRLVAGSALDGFTPYSADGRHAAELRRLYLAFFDREPDGHGAAFWQAKRGAGMPLAVIAGHFSRSAEFRARYGDVSDASFVSLVYRNVLGRTADVTGLEYWRTRLAEGMSRGRLMAHFSESVEFRGRTDTLRRGQQVAAPRGNTVTNPDTSRSSSGGLDGHGGRPTTTTTMERAAGSAASAASATSTTSSTSTTSPPATTTTTATTGGPVGTSSVPEPSVPSNFDPSSWLVAPWNPNPDRGYPAFRMFCEFSHVAYHDPIVAPGDPSFMHLHMFFGNTGVDHNSSYRSLRSSGGSTCDGGPLNRTAYWMPAVFDGQGRVVAPDTFELYYKAENAADPRSVQPYPNGLRMIAGSRTDGNTSGAGVTWGWRCGDGPSAGTIPECPSGQRLTGWVRFPYCWDGRALDSSDHRSHLRYGTNNTWGPCPSSHPIHLPELTEFVHFAPASGTSGWFMSSDRMGAQRPNGSTLHADWFGAWDNSIQDRWVTNCLRGNRNASNGNLCDGQQLRPAPDYTGPNRLTGWNPMPHTGHHHG